MQRLQRDKCDIQQSQHAICPQLSDLVGILASVSQNWHIRFSALEEVAMFSEVPGTATFENVFGAARGFNLTLSGKSSYWTDSACKHSANTSC